MADGVPALLAAAKTARRAGPSSWTPSPTAPKSPTCSSSAEITPAIANRATTYHLRCRIETLLALYSMVILWSGDANLKWPTGSACARAPNLCTCQGSMGASRGGEVLCHGSFSKASQSDGRRFERHHSVRRGQSPQRATDVHTSRRNRVFGVDRLYGSDKKSTSASSAW